MKLIFALCIFATIAFVYAESDSQEPDRQLADQINGFVKREAVDEFMMASSNDAASRDRRAPKNPCDVNWFKRMMNLDTFACNVQCSGQHWRAGKCNNRNCVCY